MPPTEKEAWRKKHSPTGEREETVNVFKQARKQHAKDVQMKHIEVETTGTTKLVRETGRPRQDGDIQRCVGIAAFNFSLVTHLFLIYFTSLI